LLFGTLVASNIDATLFSWHIISLQANKDKDLTISKIYIIRDSRKNIFQHIGNFPAYWKIMKGEIQINKQRLFFSDLKINIKNEPLMQIEIRYFLILVHTGELIN
jgi:hypothetical protein